MAKAIHRMTKDSHGFTLAESLIAILILLLMTSLVASGIPLAVRAYNQVVDAANAQTLLSTTMVVLREELGLATDAKIADNAKSVTYSNGRTGTHCEILLGDSEQNESIQIQEYKYEYKDGELDPTYPDTGKTQRPLVPNTAATEQLSTEYTSISYNPATGIFTIDGLCVKKGDQELAKLETYEIRTLNAKPTT